MEVILLEKIRNLGGIGEKVKVKRGYGRNYLIPQGKAVLANAANLAAFEARRAELEKHEQETLATVKKRAESLSVLTITIPVKASEEGKLYGSIGSREIAEAIEAAGCAVERREVDLPEGPIRQVGEHPVILQLHSDVTVKLLVQVIASE